MFPEFLPRYAIGPLLGLAVNGILCLLCLVMHGFDPGRRPMRSLFFFYLSMSVFFLGYTVYACQHSRDSIVVWYRIMMMRLGWFPLSWVWFAGDLRGRGPGRLFWAALACGAVISAALMLGDHPAILGTPLESLGAAGVMRPQSWFMRPAIYCYALSASLTYVILVYFRWWTGPGRPAFVRPLALGLAVWFLGGLHDVGHSLGLSVQPPFKILWLASIFLSLSHAAAAAFYFLDLERAIKRSEERFRAIFESAHDTIFLKDRSLRYTQVNPAMANLFGAAAYRLVGRDDVDLFGPEAARRIQAMDRRVLEGEVVEVEEAKRVGGEERVFDVVKAPIRDSKERIEGLCGIVRDITERKRAEEALKEANQQLEATLGALPDLLFEVDGKGVIHSCRCAGTENIHLPPGECKGRKVEEALPPAAAAVWLRAIREADQTGRRGRAEYSLPAPGGVRWYELSLAAKGPVSPSDRRFIVLARDITGRKRAEEEKERLESKLAQAQKMEALGVMAGGMAHDFNNMLAAIMGFAELASRDARRGRVREQDLAAILQAAEQARDLMTRILCFSRRQEAELRPLDLNWELRRFRERLRNILTETVYLELDLAGGLPLIRGAADQLMQVMTNLTTNARDAMPEGGKLMIQTRLVVLDEEYCKHHVHAEPGPFVRLRVSDTGVGMDEETLRQIFDPFFTTKGGGMGSGLGMSTAFGIVRSHGGHITCRAQPGQGACFDIYLRLAADWSGDYGTESTAARPDGAGGEERVDQG